ncbi:ATP-dependent DNA helicase [Caldalkalibacillus thermarum TA2.A1]|uniref:ATP-dependent DNA helicase n=1 Tax=Caldalkalibacillus thermarum (strain TA2.A1) TaxID=986075 RepID=A0A8X8L947_CALTT|nr:ATP-dependent DNA helicase RecQ [Caldalkalibacillus thermarum]QZT32603.1 ATP-dependent DNA helicase [Caldalkalibacillus thermarum TA2.A1]
MKQGSHRETMNYGEEKVNLEQLLQVHFGYRSFRHGQREIICSVLSGNDTLVVKSTGGGKSLCYQLPSFVLSGLTVVITPLISLMEDQLREARLQGRKDVMALHSGLSLSERQLILRDLHRYRLLYVSPEGIQNHQLLHHLKQRHIALFVVDEAHCISQWGHDFRTDYLKLADVREVLGRPPCLALTATATREVVEDICRCLRLVDPQTFIYSVDRPNIAIYVEKVNGEAEKLAKIENFLQKRHDPGMIYFSSRQKAEEVCQTLISSGIHDVAYYHGGMSSDERQKIQHQFLQGDLRLICATSAFGMGINKPDIRFVIHYHFPSNLESYVQEMGRASRDGERGLSYVLVQEGDKQIPYHFVEQEYLQESHLQRLFTLFDYYFGKALRVPFVKLCEQVGCSSQALETALFYLEQLEVCRFQRFKEQQSVAVTGQVTPELREQIRKTLEVLRRHKLKKIQHMYHWLNLKRPNCRRRFILDYFAHPHQQSFREQSIKPESCCDHCGLASDVIWTDVENPCRTSRAHALTWQEKVRRLWPVEGAD